MIAERITAWERDRADMTVKRFADRKAGDAALAIIIEATLAARAESDVGLALHTLDRADGALGALGSVFA